MKSKYNKDESLRWKPDVAAKNTETDYMNTIIMLLNLTIVSIGVYIAFNVNILPSYDEDKNRVEEEKKPIYWEYCEPGSEFNFYNIHPVLQALGLQRGTNASDWDFVWAYEFPFPDLDEYIKPMKPHQLFNQIPGLQYITNKLELSLTPSKYIPKSFELPEKQYNFYKYAQLNPKSQFVVKNNDHRGVELKNVSDIDVTTPHMFIQEFVQRPYLIDGHKFDFGIYVLVSSIDPLRVYMYKADILYRFCSKKYYPLDPEDVDKYVISDARLMVEDMPSLKRYDINGGYSARSIVEDHMRGQGHDPALIWTQVEDFIGELFKQKLPDIMYEVNQYTSPTNFFQLMRIDFMMDEDLKLYVMEANFSPNLGDTSYIRSTLYRHLIFNSMALVGVGRHVKTPSFQISARETELMQALDKNIMVMASTCSGDTCQRSCEGLCALCKQCLYDEQKNALLKAYKEHMNRHDFQRAFPPMMVQGDEVISSRLDELSEDNRLMYMWFQAKCNEDITYCS